MSGFLLLKKRFIAYDSFNRADSHPLGCDDLGNIWTDATGVTKVESNMMGYESLGQASRTLSYIDCFHKNVKITDKFAVNTDQAEGAVFPIFRYVDLSNYFRVKTTATSFRLEKYIGGILTVIGESTLVTPAKYNDIVEITLIDGNILVSINNVIILSVVDEDLIEATMVGVGLFGYGWARHDDFRVEAI